MHFSYDSTNFACKSNGVTHSAMGKGKHGELRQQVGLVLVYGHDTHQPFSFKLLKGNTSDQQTIEEPIERCTELRTQHPDFCCHITDRGYFSESNLMRIKKTNLKFLMAAKTSVRYIAQAIQRHKQSIFSSRNYIEDSDGDYRITEQHRLGTSSSNDDVCSDSTVYLHLYFSCKNKVREVEKFNHDLDTFENLHRQGQGKIYGIQMSKTKEKELSNFFVLDVNKEVVERRHDLIDEHISTLGFYANVTTWQTDATTAWRIYCGRDCIEKCFKFGEHDLQVDTVRIHSDEACTGKFLIYFIGLCCQEELKRRIALRTQKKLANKIHLYTSLREDGITYADILSELKGTRQRSYSNGRVLYDDISKEVTGWLERIGLKEAYMKNRPLYDKLLPDDT